MPSKLILIGRAVAVAVASTALVAAIAGCAQLPTSSKVLDGPSVQDGQNSDYLYYSPSGPVNGQTQIEVINSFLNAATGPQNDYQTAREFLAPSLKAKWSPNDQVLIQQGSLTLVSLPNNAASVSINVAATVDTDGHYQANAQPVTRTLDFKLVQVNGQWRISQAPNAIVLIRPVFDVIFHSYSVYFFDHSYSYLVPDLRWFPSRASTATRLVTALLAGPSPWLAGAVESTMPADTKLAIDAVTVEKGVAQVSLNAAALMASQSAKQYFLAQLQSTLMQLPTVTKVQILIDRSPQKIASYQPASTGSSTFAPVALISGNLEQMSSPSGSQLTGSRQAIALVGANEFALTADEKTLALRSTRGIYRVRLGQISPNPILVDSRADLLAPQFDRRSMLWSITKLGTAAIQVLPTKGSAIWLAVPWLKDYTVRDFSLSAEGARVALVVTNKKLGTKVVVASVIRDKTGLPIGLGLPHAVAAGSGTPVSIEWSGETQILVMLAQDASTSVSLYTVGGDSRNLGFVTDGAKIIASDSGSDIYVLSHDGVLLQYRGYTWSTLAQSVTAAHLPN
jgi:hypothetical protein